MDLDDNSCVKSGGTPARRRARVSLRRSEPAFGRANMQYPAGYCKLPALTPPSSKIRPMTQRPRSSSLSAATQAHPVTHPAFWRQQFHAKPVSAFSARFSATLFTRNLCHEDYRSAFVIFVTQPAGSWSGPTQDPAGQKRRPSRPSARVLPVTQEGCDSSLCPLPAPPPRPKSKKSITRDFSSGAP